MRTEVAVVLLTTVVAVGSAMPYAGGWNDGSRLATAECVGERGTFVIDESIFVKVPADNPPYPEHAPWLRKDGTADKLFIDGHFYSDKPPVLGLLMGGVYRAWLFVGGPTAAERPDLFCWFLTVFTSGVAYVVAVWCVFRLGVVVGLSGRTLTLFTPAFGVCTIAPTYAQHVNGHVVQLAVAAALCLALAGGRRFALAGFLAGFGYTLDLGIGPGLLACTLAYCWHVGGLRMFLLALLCAAPWVGLHHALNYAIGGTVGPANAVPQYLMWPGSPFTEANMTGGLKHDAAGFLLYGADMLFGKKGFLLHNLPLWLVPGSAVLLAWHRPRLRPVVAFALSWPLLGWAAYAATSSNLSGMCCSVRWFVPFLAPGFWLIALALREFPRYRPDFAWLCGVGAVLSVLAWWRGTWAQQMPPGLWGWVALAAVGRGVIRWRDYIAAGLPAVRVLNSRTRTAGKPTAI